jgi:hypothetical protein
MVAFVVTVAAALVLLLTTEWPHWTQGDLGVEKVAPGLLTVDPVARGEVTLGNSYTVAMQASGIRIARGAGVMVDTVTRGAFLSALTGSVQHHREVVSSDLSDIRIASLEIQNGHAIWHGTAYRSNGGASTERPLLVDATLSGGIVRVTFRVAGVDGLVLHLDPRPATIGLPPALPDRNLRLRGWWVTGSAVPLFDNVLKVVVGLAPGTKPRAVDLSPDGLVDLHVWADEAVLMVSTQPGFAMGDS